MFIKKIEIENYRLLKNVSIDLDNSATLIVGKNNCGKTSFMDLLESVINKKPILFDDYPIKERVTLYENIKSFLKKEITYDDFSSKILLPKIRFYIDYSMESPDEPLGALAPFIIDIDENITNVIIDAEYTFTKSEETFRALFEDCDDDNEKIKRILEDNYINFYNLNIYSLLPNNEEKKGKMDYSAFQKLFPLYKIAAERSLDESENGDDTPLKSLMTSIFQDELDKSLENVEDKINDLKNICKEMKIQSQEQINQLLSNIVQNSFQFGYPSADDLQLTARTKIELEKQILSSANLFYKNSDETEMLPSTYNGLGYKNLIKIELKLIDFKNILQDQNTTGIPIVYIEEPEAHMHPQMQQRFIEHIEDFCKNLETKNIQIIITSHSSHIVNSTDFSKVRYIKKNQDYIEVKNLNDFCDDQSVVLDDKEFLKKYLTINKCDLFFCDKAILIEGTAERLLIPDMITKLTESHKLKGDIPLSSQYYSLIEVGGAYAYKFIPLLKFLDIPSLIITDLDSVGSDRKQCLVSEGVDTSNATIKHWFNNIINKNLSGLQDVIALKEKTAGKIHIEFQVEELGLCGRSLEEAIKNKNRALFGIGDSPEESKLQYNAYRDGSKTDFALNLLFIPEKTNYEVPKYIEDGLVWLNEQ